MKCKIVQVICKRGLVDLPGVLQDFKVVFLRIIYRVFPNEPGNPGLILGQVISNKSNQLWLSIATLSLLHTRLSFI